MFEVPVWTGTGLVYSLSINSMTKEQVFCAISSRKPWNMNDAHEGLRHSGKDTTR